MKFLITGADGMVGSRLTKYLRRKGHEVTEFVGDVRDQEAWENYKTQRYTFLIHLAALAGVRASFENPEEYYDVNVNGTANARDFSMNHCDKMLYASSSNAYEWWGNPYAATKKMNEVQLDGFDAIGMRFHTIWPGRPDMLFRKFEAGQVKYINRGHLRDFININDLLDGIYTIITNYDKLIMANKTICDIGTGHATPVGSVAEIFGFDGEWRDDNPAGERVHTKADIDYLLALGWSPKYNILIKDHHVDYE